LRLDAYGVVVAGGRDRGAVSDISIAAGERRDRDGRAEVGAGIDVGAVGVDVGIATCGVGVDAIGVAVVGVYGDEAAVRYVHVARAEGFGADARRTGLARGVDVAAVGHGDRS